VKIKGIKNKTQLLFKRPGWLPEGYAKTCKATPIDLRSKYDPPVAGATKAYVFGQFLITVAVSLSLAGLATLASPVELWAAAGFIVLSLFTHGYILDNRRLAAPLESARLLLAIALAFLLPLGSTLSALLGFSAAASLIVVGISIALQRNILGAGDQEIRKGGNSEGLAKASV